MNMRAVDCRRKEVVMVNVKRDICSGCGECARSCLTGAIRLDESGLAFADPQGLCIRCGHCISTCPEDALSFEGEAAAPKNYCTGDYNFDISAFLREKRSKRNYEDRAVEREVIMDGITLAQHAPCSANGHKVHWVVLPTKEKVAEFFDLTRKEFVRLGVFGDVENSMAIGKNLVTFNAPAMLFVYADDGAFIPHADCVIAMLYADLYWRNKGMGTCWSAFALEAPNNSPAVREFLGIPEGKTCYGAVSLGYPNEPEYRLIPERPAPVVDWK